MTWVVNYTDSARKQLKKLDKPTAIRILNYMDERIANSANPRDSGKSLKGPRLGAYWRYRVGEFRIICNIQDQTLCILVIEIGGRKEIYRQSA